MQRNTGARNTALLRFVYNHIGVWVAAALPDARSML
jgi:hypothetical protein